MNKIFSDDFDLKEFIDEGGDINTVEDGIHLVKFCLNMHNNTVESYEVLLEILANPACIIDRNTIQDDLYDNFMHLPLYFLTDNVEQSTFIQRLDLTKPITVEPNHGENANEKCYSISWLQYMISGINHLDCFDWARQYHPDYSLGLLVKDQLGLNPWHSLGHYLVNNDIEEYIHPCMEVFEKLFEDYPQGLNEKNNDNENPAQCVKNKRFIQPAFTHNCFPRFDIQIELVIKTLERMTRYYNLNTKVPNIDKGEKAIKIKI